MPELWKKHLLHIYMEYKNIHSAVAMRPSHSGNDQAWHKITTDMPWDTNFGSCVNSPLP